LNLQVSILVFLDQALKGFFFYTTARFIIGFNPCFPGSSAESGFAVIQDPKGTQVSILVFLDQALKEYNRHGPTRRNPVFQSLFSWIKR